MSLAAILGAALVALAMVVLSVPNSTSAAARVYVVPRSIDRTGAQDVSSALNRFVGGVPNGSTVKFRKGGIYRVDSGVRLDNRHHLTFDGNGSTLRSSGCGPTSSPFLLGWGGPSSFITIKHFRLRGSNAQGGTPATFHDGCQNQMGVAIYQSSHVTIAHVSISRMNGDCVYLDYGYGNHNWSHHVTVRDSKCSGTGRSGVAIVAGTQVTVKNTRFEQIGMYALNIEPNYSDGGGTYVTFKDNVIGKNGVASEFGGHMVCANGGAAGAPIHHLTITGNRAIGETLSTYIWEPRSRAIVFKDNRSSTPASGPVVVIDHADGVTVTGNRQAMRTGSFARFNDSTQVVYSDNN